MKRYLSSFHFKPSFSLVTLGNPLRSFNGNVNKNEFFSFSLRCFTFNATPAELEITNKLNQAFQPTHISVQDISGGCGSMYRIEILSNKFKDLPKVQQQRLVNQVLKEDIQKWHGVQLFTGVPEDSSSKQ